MVSVPRRVSSAKKPVGRAKSLYRPAVKLLEDRRLMSGFVDHFEGATLDPFWSTTQNSGSITFPSTAQVHSGSQAVQLNTTLTGNDKYVALDHTFTAPTYGRVSVWFYDTGADIVSSNYIGLQLDNSQDSHYRNSLFTFDYDLGAGQNGSTYYFNPNTTDTISTGVDRTQAWHQFSIDVTPTLATYQVDGTTVYTGSNTAGFDSLHLWMGGPSWRPAWTSYFDDFEFTPANDPPVLATIPDQSVSEGARLSLTASATDPDPGDTLTFSLDAAPAGATIDANTGRFDFTPTDGPANYSVTVRVTDNGSPALSDTKTFNISVNNVAPTASLASPSDGFQGVSNQPRTFTLGATDPSSTDQAAGFTYAVDWGDGHTDNFSGLSGIPATHAYASPGGYTVTLTATDKDGDTSPPVSQVVHIQQVEQQGTTLAVGGTAEDDNIVLTAGSTSGTVSVSVNGSGFGSYTASQVQVFGGDGNDQVAVQGTGGADSFTISSNTVSLRGVAIGGDSIEEWQVNGLAGNDKFTVVSGDLPVQIDGGTGTNTLIGGSGANTWVITGQDAGTLNGTPFTNIANLTGGSASDGFTIAAGAGVSGTINGGGSTDTLDYSSYGSPVTVDLQTKTATGLGKYSSIESFLGSNGSDTLIGPNAATTWQVTGNDSGKAGSIAFASFENLTGGSGNDTFKFSNGKLLSGVLDGGAGSNTLSDALYTTGVAVDLSAGTATGVGGGIRNIQIVMGGSGNDTLTAGSANAVLVGGAGNDVLTGGSSRSILIGGKGGDTITGGSDDDIVIGGTTSYDANSAALQAILTEWGRTDETYQQRIDHIRGTVSGGLNGAFDFKAATVLDDATADVLAGGPGMDWFWAQLGEISDLAAGEQVN